MKKVISLILICAHLTAVFHFTVPYLSYYANFDYFATEVCINKDNPEIACNGTCKLNEMLHQEHQRDKNPNAAHNIDRAPKIHFFFQHRFSALHLVNNHAEQPFLTETEAFDALWQSEPVSPPPQVV